MLTRSEMRRLAQAARNGWSTPIEQRRQAVAGVPAVQTHSRACEAKDRVGGPRATECLPHHAGFSSARRLAISRDYISLANRSTQPSKLAALCPSQILSPRSHNSPSGAASHCLPTLVRDTRYAGPS
jgi:hypothetical protein